MRREWRVVICEQEILEIRLWLVRVNNMLIYIYCITIPDRLLMIKELTGLRVSNKGEVLVKQLILFIVDKANLISLKVLT